MMSAFIQPVHWARTAIARIRSGIDARHQRAIRKSIWKVKEVRRQAHSEFLMQQSRIYISNDSVAGTGTADNHHRLVAIIFNGLVDKVAKSSQDAIDMPDIFQKISVLVSAIGDHFLNEEQKMKAYNYPGFGAHKKQHDNFLADVMMFVESMTNSECDVAEFIHFIGSWWSGHVVISDKNFCDFLDTRRASEIAAGRECGKGTSPKPVPGQQVYGTVSTDG